MAWWKSLWSSLGRGTVFPRAINDFSSLLGNVAAKPQNRRFGGRQFRPAKTLISLHESADVVDLGPKDLVHGSTQGVLQWMTRLARQQVGMSAQQSVHSRRPETFAQDVDLICAEQLKRDHLTQFVPIMLQTN